MWYVYILRCANGELYKGCTNNIKELFERHCNGYVDSTKNLLPVELIGYTAFNDKYKAFLFEKYLKTGSGRAYCKTSYLSPAFAKASAGTSIRVASTFDRRSP
jgi:predicted GIY-YIG superfamily endonuclease